MASPEDVRPGPDIESFIDEPTRELADWLWLWKGDHQFPIRSHRSGLLGKLIVTFKRLLRPLVKAPQSDLWDRQRVFNEILVATVSERLDHLEKGYDRLGSDLQKVQHEILEDLRGFQEDYWRDTGDLATRLKHLESFKRDGFGEVMQHSDALYARLDQKLDRYRRKLESLADDAAAGAERSHRPQTPERS